MKQSGNTTQNANLQEFLDSATNAADFGQRQFYTPPTVADALFRPMPALCKELATDLHFGNGALARASGAKLALGLDIDARVKAELQPPAKSKWNVAQADLTLWYPIAHEADLRFPYITINPPFSLRWHSERLTALQDSSIPEVTRAYNEHRKDTIDSTLASFLIALDRLLPNGEGFMVCNAATARRFFGAPDEAATNAKHRDLRKFIWLWLEIPGKIFDNQHTEFDTAVLYFSRHKKDSPPLFLTAPAADTLAIERTLMVPEVFTAYQGTRFRYDYEFAAHVIAEKFNLVNREYAVRHHGKQPDWNISLDAKGRLKTYLTPFQHVSRKIPPALAAKLHAIDGQTPVALCVTATTRTALREATECGIWRIHPDVPLAIADAMASFDAEGAPFFTPSLTQALGWVDEFSTLGCIEPGIGSALPGDACPITCSIEPTTWMGEKINLAGEPEDLEYTGKELLVVLTDPAGVKHHFHVRRDNAAQQPELDSHGKIKTLHWHIADLIAHFHLPVPKDLATLQPERYQENLAMIDRIEARIRQHLALAN